MKNIILAVIALIIIAGGVYYFIQSSNSTDVTYEKPTVNTEVPTQNQTADEVSDEGAEAVSETEPTVREPIVTIGQSVSGKDIAAYHFGTGDRELLLVGGIHGGYSWNTALLAYEVIDWLTKNPAVIPDDVSVTIIPNLNPDGLFAITGKEGVFSVADVKGNESARVAARFNSNDVDLNRNFDCEWKREGAWQNRNVSGGSAPFSEPETAALKNYVTKHEPTMVVAWYSSAGGVYASRCGDTTMGATRTLTNTFAAAAGYKAYEEFDYYEITGDMVNWFAKLEIPAISVLLTTHEQTELSKNKSGIEAVLKTLSD